MRILNRLKYRYQEEAGNEGDSGGQSNNNANKVDDYSDVWNTDGNSNQQDAQQVQRVEITNQQQSGTELTPDQKLQAHIDSLNLMEGFDPSAMADPETAMKTMQQLVTNTYAATIKDANQIMDQRLANLKEELQQETQDNIRGNESVNAMNSALNYTAKPAYKPVADALLVKFQQQGKSNADAIIEVGKYFATLSGDVQNTMPQGNANNKLNGNTFQGINSPNSDNAEPEDWVNFLSAKTK